MASSIRPFTLSIPDEELADLQQRLASTRWPSSQPANGWREGPPCHAMQELLSHWQHHYDWRKCEAWFNSYPQYTASIDGEEIHFLHIKSAEANALPMLMIHGWPGSVLEFRKVIQPLADPQNHGGRAGDAFHLIIPSLPGYGWSSKPTERGWGVKRISRAFVALMEALGYQRWVAQGGDWGADIVAMMASDDPPPSLHGIHMNTVFFDATKEIEQEPNNEDEALALRKHHAWLKEAYGYFLEQQTRPQTMAYLLADSPVGQAAWIYEKIFEWSQHSGDLASVLTLDEVLDNVMVYWLSNSGGSSARLYLEGEDDTALRISIPVGVSVFPGDPSYAPRSWGERYYSKIVHWREVEKGGHFAAWEVPELFVREVRDTFRHVLSDHSLDQQ